VNAKYENCDDAKGVIRSKSRKDRQHNGQMLEDTKGWLGVVNRRRRKANILTKRKRTKWQTTIYKTLHRNLKLRATQTPIKPERN